MTVFADINEVADFDSIMGTVTDRTFGGGLEKGNWPGAVAAVFAATLKPTRRKRGRKHRDHATRP